MGEKRAENVVQWVYSSQNNTELADRYDEWAGSYDKDLDTDFGWLSPRKAVEAFAELVPRNGRVLDAGAGTGLVGELLHGLGYEELMAMDLSQGMLDAAARKNVYKEFHRMAMGSTAGLPAGLLRWGHQRGRLHGGARSARFPRRAGARHSSRRPHRVLAPARTSTSRTASGRSSPSLEAEGKWRLVEEGEKYRPMPKGEPEVYHQVWTYQIL